MTTTEAARPLRLKGAECGGSKSACANLDGTRSRRVLRRAMPAARQSRFHGGRLVVAVVVVAALLRLRQS